uniref:Uncharacterized protein n=1 Tax=Anguilla anguilla TaxID=7936 RepID=A0A0E9X4S0_ANGAN
MRIVPPIYSLMSPPTGVNWYLQPTQFISLDGLNNKHHFHLQSGEQIVFFFGVSVRKAISIISPRQIR